MLIDWVLTMHTYDIAREQQLTTLAPLRKKIASVITHEEIEEVVFSPEEMQYLLLSVPITFRFYKEDVGYSLKGKLLATLTTPKVDWGLEVKVENDNTGKDDTKDIA